MILPARPTPAPPPSEASCYDVLLIGGYFCDLIFTGLPEIPRLGADLFGERFDIVPGGAFNTAHALRHLELRTGWPCDLGNDLFSRFFLEEARRVGIDESLFRHHDQPYRMVSVSFSFVYDRGFISFSDKLPETGPIAPLIREYRPRALMIGSLGTGAYQEEMVAAAREVGTVVLMDSQWNKYTVDMPEVEEALRRVDIFMPNESEALQLTAAPTIEEALAVLAMITPLVVIKAGGRGAMAAMGSHRWSVPAIPVEVQDTTGAGDAFNAGFLYGYLSGQPIERCLAYANLCGGMAASDCGMIAVPKAAEIEELADHFYPDIPAGLEE